MALFSRNVVLGIPPPSCQVGSPKPDHHKTGDPTSNYFQYPIELIPLTPPKLVRWMWECQQKEKLGIIQPFSRHLHGAKKLCNEYDHDQLIRATRMASQLAKHPFSLKFVEKVLTENFQD